MSRPTLLSSPAAVHARVVIALVSLTLGGCFEGLGNRVLVDDGGSGGATSSAGSGGTGGTAGAGTGGGSGGACAFGETRPCYSGPAGTEGVGICKGGTQLCDTQGTFSGPCVGEVLPQPETCDTPVDDDCNGQVNEGGDGCACTPGATESCYDGPAGTLGVGVCKAGTRTCNAQGTGWGPCAGEVTPQQETCLDTVDNDCNGETNEDGPGCVCTPNETVSCYSGPSGTLGVGVCKAGTKTCDAQGTAYGPCTGEVTPQPETCNTPVDDDCNGQVNEGGLGCVCVPSTTASCYAGPAGTEGVGICKAGTKTCDAQGTAWGPCNGEVLPLPAEDCFNALDDDCNGQANDNCSCNPGDTVPCYSGPPGTLGVGICAAGTRTCDAQGVFGPCVGDVTPQPETCLDMVDNDCNGQVNEGGAGCLCVPGATASCYTGPAGTEGVGACKAGTKTCDAQGVSYGPCTGDVTPQPETCLTPVDDDCNGLVNETGPGCLCVPGSTQACYTGPAGTLGVGVCAAGTSTCDALGTAWGPCTGEVLPKPEDCSTPADEDCDGATPPCAGALAWAKSWGSVVDDEGITVTADPANNVILGGYFNGTVDFGCGPISAGASDGALLAKFTPSGACLWSKRFGVNANVNNVATDAQGNVFLTGNYSSAIDLGGGSIPAAGGGDVYVAKFDANGNHLWSKGFGDTAGQTSVAVAADPSGNVYAYGYFQGTINFGGGNLTSQGGNDLYLAKLGPTGTHLWSKRFGDASGQLAKGLATDAQGNVLLTGNLSGSIDFGGGTLTSAGLADIFLAKLSPTGAHLWSKRFGDATDQNGTGVRADAQGNVLFTGYFNGTIDLGTGPLTSLGGADIFLAKLDPSGAPIWAQARGGANNQSSLSLAVDPTGAAAITGVLTGTADFGTGPLTNAGGGDIYVAKYDAAGTPIYSKRFGDTAAQGGKCIAVDGTGAVLVTGIIFGPTDFGAGPVPVIGGEDIYLVKLGP